MREAGLASGRSSRISDHPEARAPSRTSQRPESPMAPPPTPVVADRNGSNGEYDKLDDAV